jgi:hypothetical protein
VEHLTWTSVDKSSWGIGPWTGEPDKEQWTDTATGFPCLVVRNHAGALCGYVGVPAGHPWYGVDKWRIAPRPDVHGGVNYSGSCQVGPENVTICHVDHADNAPVWWLGFDCTHMLDLAPGAVALWQSIGVPNVHRLIEGCTYRPIGYVRENCERLALCASRVCRGEVVS